MLLAAIAVGLLILSIAGAVLLRARRLALRAARARSEALEPASRFPTVAVVPARHLSTHLAGTRIELSTEAFPIGLHGSLGVTEHEVVLEVAGDRRIHVPVARVSEAALVGSFEGEAAGEGRLFLRVAWERGGEAVASVFEVRARRPETERVRREIHLRAGRAATLWQPPADPGGPAEGA